MDGFAPTIERPAESGLLPGRADPDARIPAPSPREERRSRLRAARPFILSVLLPTLLVASYYFLIAANQYESEAHFIVKTNDGGPGPISNVGQALGLGGAPAGQAEARSIDDYLLSHDAVAALDQSLNLRATFSRPEADPISRLWPSHATPETLLQFYRRQVTISYNNDSGVTTLKVRAFRPVDARAIAEELLGLGEARVNSFNQRALQDGLSVARKQLGDAEDAVAAAQSNLTGMRQEKRDIDPDRSSAAAITLASSLQQQLALTRAQLASMSAAVSADSPQRTALAQQVRALETQAAAAQSRMAGPTGSMASTLGAFEGLKLRQEFAAKRYEAAATALESAREQALRQQMFVVRVVEPNMPVKALYPERWKIVATVLAGLLLAYAIGWLILAGVREHVA